MKIYENLLENILKKKPKKQTVFLFLILKLSNFQCSYKKYKENWAKVKFTNFDEWAHMEKLMTVNVFLYEEYFNKLGIKKIKTQFMSKREKNRTKVNG